MNNGQRVQKDDAVAKKSMKNVQSKAYHAKLRECLTKGMSEMKSKAKAREAGAAAAEEWANA